MVNLLLEQSCFTSLESQECIHVIGPIQTRMPLPPHYSMAIGRYFGCDELQCPRGEHPKYQKNTSTSQVNAVATS